jgi:hypothetical protein
LTKGFTAIVRARIEKDAAFAEALRREASDAVRAGDVAVGNELLRASIEATTGVKKPGNA